MLFSKKMAQNQHHFLLNFLIHTVWMILMQFIPIVKFIVFFPIETDVSIACLTCYGALISLPLPSEDSGKSSLPRREMEAWLKEDPNGRLWIFDHCVQLIMQQGTLCYF